MAEVQLIVFELRNRNRQFKLFGSPHSQTFVSTFLFGCCMNFVVAISVTYSYILSIGLQDKIGILVNQVFKVERQIPEKQTKSKTGEKNKNRAKLTNYNTWNVLAKTHAIVFVHNVTSAQYLAKKLVSLLSLLRSEQHSIEIYSCKGVNF